MKTLPMPRSIFTAASAREPRKVIYGEGKTPEQIKGIVERMGEKGCRNILVTRISQETGDYLSRFLPIDYHKIPRLGIAFPEGPAGTGNIVVAHRRDQRHAGGRKRRALTAEAMGNHVTRVYDVAWRDFTACCLIWIFSCRPAA